MPPRRRGKHNNVLAKSMDELPNIMRAVLGDAFGARDRRHDIALIENQYTKQSAHLANW